MPEPRENFDHRSEGSAWAGESRYEDRVKGPTVDHDKKSGSWSVTNPFKKGKSRA